MHPGLSPGFGAIDSYLTAVRRRHAAAVDAMCAWLIADGYLASEVSLEEELVFGETDGGASTARLVTTATHGPTGDVVGRVG